jgi:eukaryotic-like serine/threonine-protein kinase
LLQTPSNAAYAEPGYLLYADNSTLMGHPFDLGKLELHGSAVTIADSVSNSLGPVGADFSVSSSGLLVYTSDKDQTLALKWFERDGKAAGSIGSGGRLANPAISPDGGRIAFNRLAREGNDIWLLDVARGSEERFTSERANEVGPVWSPDGASIVYMQGSGNGAKLFRKRADGIAAPEPLNATGILARDWSRDGRYVLGDSSPSGRTQGDLWVLPVVGEQKLLPFAQSEFNELHGKFSPGGDWIAYMSNRTGRSEVYIASFPEPDRTQRVSVSAGDYPVWSRDGREIYYMGQDGTIWAAAVKGSGRSLSIESPKALFRVPLIVQPRAFDVAKDGRFLIPVAEAPSTSVNSVTLMQNWTGLLDPKTP